MAKQNNALTTQPLEPLILMVRGTRVMLDVDLARIYGVTTKRFNEAFKRNRDRFPDDFAFRLTREEWDKLLGGQETGMWSQIATTSQKYRRSNFLPVGIHRAWSTYGCQYSPKRTRDGNERLHHTCPPRRMKLREHTAANDAILKRLAEIDNALLFHDTKLRELYQRIIPMLQAPPIAPKRKIGFRANDEK